VFIDSQLQGDEVMFQSNFFALTSVLLMDKRLFEFASGNNEKKPMEEKLQ
jgi:hypothetical protein